MFYINLKSQSNILALIDIDILVSTISAEHLCYASEMLPRTALHKGLLKPGNMIFDMGHYQCSQSCKTQKNYIIGRLTKGQSEGGKRWR